ncbi:hypothetical protein DL95DRAFT_521084 [Leptodontidium sp. 2 PMI_412]|nr:hypothetical protein DL95DRAFT_521084 [Leptodontidium sp. 2 PMI_412]
MVEVLGVVASGIAVTQLAGQVTKSIIKLKEYWDQVQEAPAEIKYLLREIDSLSLILSHIQDDQAKQTTGGIQVDNLCIRQSLELCKEGADELRGLADELAEKIDGKKGWRKKVGSVKVVLKREDVKKLKKRMKNAIRLLSLSYQWHTNAMIQIQPDIIVSRMTEHISSLAISDNPQQSPKTQPSSSKDQETAAVVQRQYDMWISSPSWVTYLFGQFEYHQRTRLHKGRRREDITTKYKLPQFIANRVLELQGHNTLSGWKVNIQTYRVLPYDNPFFSAITKGDIVAIRHMLANKEYFITDRDPYLNRTALHSLPAYTLNSQYRAREHIAIAAGIALGWSWDKCSALNVEYWMDGNSDTKGEMVDWVDSEGSNFLHCLARGFGQFSWATNYREMNSQIEHDAARAWHRLICRSISAGCSIFSVDHSGKTILSTVIDEYLTYYLYGNRPLWDIQLVLREWLDDLAGCGIDLLAYGDAEKAHWHLGNWGYECSCPQRPVNGDAVLCNTQHVSYHHYPKRWHCHDDYPKKGITVRFVYGPQPEDWIFDIEERGLVCARDFWRMVEGSIGDEPCPTEAFDDEPSSEEWSENEEGERDMEPAAQPVPGSWI